MQIQNPHDKFFKETFSDVEVTGDFIQNYLPNDLVQMVDVHTLQPEKDSFIDKELKEVFSDLLFKAQINGCEGYIYFLFEHKSYVTNDIALQLLKYMLNIWEAKYKKEKKEKLPIIIPIVVYHGKNSWHAKPTLGEMLEGYDELPDSVKRFVPNFQTLLYDFTQYTDEQIKGDVKQRMTVIILRDIFLKEGEDLLLTMFRVLEYLKRLKNDSAAAAYLETFLRYIFQTGRNLTDHHMKEVVERLENTFPQRGEAIMTWAELYMEKGREEGIQKGREEGIEEGKRKQALKVAIKLLTKRFGVIPNEMREKLQALNMDTLEAITDDIFHFETLDDVKKYLNEL